MGLNVILMCTIPTDSNTWRHPLTVANLHSL